MNTKDSLVTCSLIAVLVSWGVLFGVFSISNFFTINSFAQKTVTPIFDSSVLYTNKTVHFNTYENNEIGISLKYPSNFLIDESKSNNTLKQTSFYPVNNVNFTPEQYILWIDVLVQNLKPVQDLSSSPSNSSPTPSYSSSLSQSNITIDNYVKNLVNSIQNGNKDVTIIESSANSSLSGHPAFKLITKSYFNNIPVDDVDIGTIVNNKLYQLNYQTESSNYLNSLPNANKIIQSFKIIAPSTATAAGVPLNQNLNLNKSNSNSNSNPAMFPTLNNLLSSFKLDNLSNNSPKILKTLKNSITNSVNNLLANSTNAVNKSLLDSSLSSLSSLPSPSSLQSPLSSLPSGTLEKVCNIPLISNLCNSIVSVGGGGGGGEHGPNGINNNTIDIKSKNSTNTVSTASNLSGKSNSIKLLEKTPNSTAGTSRSNISESNKLIEPFKGFSNSSQSPSSFSSLFSNLLSTIITNTNNSSENGIKNENTVLNNNGSLSGTTIQSNNNGTNDALKILGFLQGIGR